MTISKVSTFAIDPVRKNSSVDCDCEMVSAEAMVPALCAAEDDDQKRIDDVELTSARPGRADHGESAAGDTGNAASEPESEPVDPPRIDADGAGHGAIRRDAAHLQSPARAEQQQRDAGCDQQRQAHDEQAIDLHFDRVCHLQRAHHPGRQLDADFACAEARAEGLLHDQAHPQVASSVSSGRR